MATDPNLIAVEDVEAVAREIGELRAARRRLGAAAGTVRVGLSQWELPPGARSTPVHVHADEEEICYVLSGSGLSWQDGKTYPIQAGDCIVHRIQAEAHTVIAGDSGLTYLMFGEGSETNLTWLPRPKMMWAASRWIPTDGQHPFKAEVEAGPLELPDEPEAQRPATIVTLDDCEADDEQRDGYKGLERKLAAAGGAVRSGLRHVILRPGQVSCPPHWHTVEEEIFYVLGGSGQALLGDDRLDIQRGSVLVRPPGSGVAHALRAGDDGMTYLVYGTRVPADICFYPRSNKVNIMGVLFEVTPVDYWVGEEQAPE